MRLPKLVEAQTIPPRVSGARLKATEFNDCPACFFSLIFLGEGDWGLHFMCWKYVTYLFVHGIGTHNQEITLSLKRDFGPFSSVGILKLD